MLEYSIQKARAIIGSFISIHEQLDTVDRCSLCGNDRMNKHSDDCPIPPVIDLAKEFLTE